MAVIRNMLHWALRGWKSVVEPKRHVRKKFRSAGRVSDAKNRGALFVSIYKYLTYNI